MGKQLVAVEVTMHVRMEVDTDIAHETALRAATTTITPNPDYPFEFLEARVLDTHLINSWPEGAYPGDGREDREVLEIKEPEPRPGVIHIHIEEEYEPGRHFCPCVAKGGTFDKPLLDADKIIIPEREIDVEFSYPLSTRFTRTCTGRGDGITVQEIVDCIRDVYEEIYRDAEDRNEKYGVWGHGICDLMIEAMYYRPGDTVVKLGIGS